MPVTVECALQPSRWRLLSAAVPLLAGSLFGLLLALPVWSLIIWLVAGFLFWAHARSGHAPEYLRFQGGDLVIWERNEPLVLSWSGEGRRSHAFLQWDLVDEQSQSLSLWVWRDSVSDSSWRALNMAFRVEQAAIRSRAASD